MGAFPPLRFPSPSMSLVCAMLIKKKNTFFVVLFFSFFLPFFVRYPFASFFLCFLFSFLFCLRERSGDGKHVHEVGWGGSGRIWGQGNNMNKT